MKAACLPLSLCNSYNSVPPDAANPIIRQMQKDKLEKLATERGFPCVTISMNTNRTYPDNQKDSIELKNLMREAHDHVVNEFGQHEVTNLLEKIDCLDEVIDLSNNLDSLHIFLSGTTSEIVKSSWPTLKNTVSVAENFVIKPLIKAFNRIEDYLILLLSQSDVRLLHAVNDITLGEINSEDFSYDKDINFLTEQDKSKDGKQADNRILEFFNQIDKAVVKVHNKTEMNVVVICSDTNWSKLMQVADKPSIYYGNVSVNFNDTENQPIAAKAFKIVSAIQEKGRAKAIQEMKEAAGHGKMITDLSHILYAIKAGKGELLIIHDDYHQAVKMTGENSFDLVTDVTQPEVIDDITSEMAWEVISKKGRAIFTNQEEFKAIGNIALKVRY